MYVYFDGDDIGRSLELLLLDDDVNAAGEYSRAVSRATQNFADFLTKQLGAQIVFTAGDEVLAWVADSQVDLALIGSFCEEFERRCGRTGSVGVGQTTTEVVSSLRKAKLLGKSRIVHGKEVRLNG